MAGDVKNSDYSVSKFACLSVLVILLHLTAPVQAQDLTKDVSALLAEGYEIKSSFPVPSGLVILMQKQKNAYLCTADFGGLKTAEQIARVLRLTPCSPIQK